MQMFNYLSKNWKIDFLAIVLLFISFFALSYKLNYESFFTDEILYVKTGILALKHEYTQALEVPPLGKYLAGFAARQDEYNVFQMRLPYVLISTLSCLLVYKLLKEYYRGVWGFVGGLLYLVSPFIFDGTRMVMMESPMLFFWLLFHWWFLKYIKTLSAKYAYLAGLAMGLGLAIKLTSVILFAQSFIFFAFLYLRDRNKEILKNAFFAYIISAFVYAFTYIDLVISQGKEGIIGVLKFIKNRYGGKEEDGKIHIVDGNVYLTSPWWYYFHYFIKQYNPFHALIVVGGLVIPFIKRNLFNSYWLTFFALTFTFSQLVTVKSPRYIIPFELPLIFLTTIFLHTIYHFKPIGKLITLLILVMLIFWKINYLNSIVPTKYTALRQYILENTNYFETGDRTMIYGAIRPSKWAFEDIDPKHKYIVSRKDLEIMAPEFDIFRFIVFDEVELLKDPNNMLYNYVMSNNQNYNLQELPGLYVYVRKTH